MYLSRLTAMVVQTDPVSEIWTMGNMYGDIQGRMIWTKESKPGRLMTVQASKSGKCNEPSFKGISIKWAAVKVGETDGN